MKMADLLEVRYLPGTALMTVLKCRKCDDILFDYAEDQKGEFSHAGLNALIIGHFASHGIEVRLKECDDPKCRWHDGGSCDEGAQA